jgi:Terminase small subunit
MTKLCPRGVSDRPANHGRQPISMATSKASTQPPGEALSPKHEAFVQAYVSRGMNGTKAYRAVYPSIKSDDVAGAAAARLLGNVRVQARIAEIMRAGAERAEVTVEQVVRELKLLGFSDIRISDEAAAAVAEVSQTVNGALRVKLVAVSAISPNRRGIAAGGNVSH